jgi:hypothetical protein
MYKSIIYRAAALLILAGCIQNPTIDPPEKSTALTAKVGGEDLAGARLVLTGNGKTDTVTVSGASALVQFPNLAGGQYDLIMIMPDGQTFTTRVDVTAGQNNYLGEIIQVDYGVSMGGQTIYPCDPTYPFPAPVSDFVAGHYPANGETVTVWIDTNTYLYPSPEPYPVPGPYPVPMYDTRNAAGAEPSNSPAIKPAPQVWISVQFTKAMNKASVESAFQIGPPAAGGAFYWNNYFQYESLTADRCLNYNIMFDKSAPLPMGAEVTVINGDAASGSAGSNDATVTSTVPDIMPGDPPETDWGTSFDFTFTPLQDTTYTVRLAATARDSAGNPVAQEYSFSFTTVTRYVEPGPVDTNQYGCACTMNYVSFYVTVLDASAQPATLDEMIITRPATGDTLYPPPARLMKKADFGRPSNGWNLVLDDMYTYLFSPAPDTVLFYGRNGSQTVNAAYVFNTDSCRCHLNRISGPDTLVLR